MASNSVQLSYTNQIIYFPYHYFILCLCPVHQPRLSVACGAQEEGRAGSIQSVTGHEPASHHNKWILVSGCQPEIVAL